MQIDLRAIAINDIEAAVTYYRNEAGPEIALEFIDTLERTINLISQHPLIGPLRFASELDIPELRSWSLQKFPYIIFYVSTQNRINIWRVLHARRDIPARFVSDPQV